MYAPSDIEKERWLNRAREDEETFTKDPPVEIDKLGIIGEKLFPLTLDNQSAIHFYRSVSAVTGETVAKGMLHALCPELECFVTLINWMGSSDNRKKERVDYYHELETFVAKKDPTKICILNGNYRIKRNEYSTIVMYYGKIDIVNRSQKFYEWERAPFLKRTGETFAYFPSPIFMSSVKSSEENVSEDKVFYFSAPFIIKGLSANMVKIGFIDATNPYLTETNVYVYDKNLVDKIKKGVNKLFLGLFEDKIFRKSGQFEREFVLLNITADEIDGNELVGHLISQRMYYNYLKNRTLEICSDEELFQRYKTIVYQTEMTYGKKVTMDWDNFCQIYLDVYFTEFDGKWYYKPYILKELNNERFKEFLEYLNICHDQSKLLYNITLHKSYNHYKIYLDFINSYNLLAKRTLIDIVNKMINIEGVSKWKI